MSVSLSSSQSSKSDSKPGTSSTGWLESFCCAECCKEARLLVDG